MKFTKHEKELIKNIRFYKFVSLATIFLSCYIFLVEAYHLFMKQKGDYSSICLALMIFGSGCLLNTALKTIEKMKEEWLKGDS